MEIDYVAIGKRIRKARKKQNLTQEQLAEMIGVKSAHISNIESGKKPFSFNVFVRLYTALKVNPDSLLLSMVNFEMPQRKSGPAAKRWKPCQNAKPCMKP